MKKVMILSALVILGCSQPTEKQLLEKHEMTVAVKDSTKTNLKKLAFAVKKDLICGMPVSAGIEDTVTYKNKLYGFCSKECKDEFLKNPEAIIAKK